MLIDSHCHLDFPDFAQDMAGTMQRAREADVARMITIATSLARHDTYRAIAEGHDNVWFTVGTHPHHAHEEPNTTVQEIVDLACHPKCIGIGEAGLDYHYDKSPRDVAAAVFRTHIDAARRTGLPLVIHARDADDDVAAILRDEMSKGAFKALLHCFTSSRSLAEAGLELGLYVSFSGVLTFKTSEELRAIAKDVPLDRLLVETDAPYLAPVPHRGKRNQPAWVADTARVLAEVKGVSFDEIAQQTTQNVLRLFSKMPPLEAAPVAA
ncbi:MULTISPECIES: TatD family hydrolase [unclassified Beijerinckia]|uniref:TatD family hydrolase n=1 Tax=unclassified Beijerinckia TaxID=2638183 RepID=UPI000899A48E|nr:MULTISPECIES: TatD family hydrolase [unclassified Beijerinckia]MDH7795083.1 TatD DNase family protein [Beijerinckia sp. GAS462]SEB86879.1 TatD DNase family protein [Beijerinckia sp. 28-YEA-48]